MSTGFLPINRKEMKERGWDQVDFVYVIGDAYVDHPSFGHAIISRVLESRGYRVGIISQPDWKNKESITVFGEPRLAFLVSAGNMDSMVNHYSVSKKRRATDAYTPGGVMGKRPDYAAVVYGNLIRQTYKQTPVILGGIEASLRRLAHYDYWSDRIKRSIRRRYHFLRDGRTFDRRDRGGAGCGDRGGRSHLSGRNGRKGEKSRFRL